MVGRGDFTRERSDLDFLAKLDPHALEATSLKTYLGFKDSLEALFGRRVDLVQAEALRNPYMKSSIASSREILFEA